MDTGFLQRRDGPLKSGPERGRQKVLTRIYVVDDHPFVREGLKTFLGTQEGITVVGESDTAQKALPEIEKLQPDIVIVDLHLPGMSGIELTRKISLFSTGIAVIILSSFSEEDEVIAAIEAGALSYILKDSPPEKLVEAIRAAKRKEPVLHPRIAKKLMEKMRQPEPVLITEQLTMKEKEVMALLTEGFSNKEIAQKLYVSESTVKSHVSSILRKLEVQDRTQAVIKVMEERLLDK